MKHRLVLPVFLAAGALWAHPMGSFSISHYSRIEATNRGVEIRRLLEFLLLSRFPQVRSEFIDRESRQ